MLALVTGRGGLPARVAAAQAAPPLVCVLEGFAPDGLAADITFRLEHLGSFLQHLKDRQVTEVCFCGAIERPPFDPTALDAATMPLVPVMMQAMGAGDDGALRAVMTLFEAQGFVIRAAHELAPELLAPEGVLTAAQPDAQMQADVARADQVLAALAPLDVGQGCVVGAGQVWGIETLGGTDHMLATLPAAVKDARALLVKQPKSGQDLRADMPTIGPRTVEAVAAVGLAGLVVRAGQVILLAPEETLERADEAGLVLWSRAPV
ncbi:LpxI family protein [Roseobacter weihaiensis]|uniref:LpxI family protein n=1 Tax=Roseobacter weihaiensis TaxID=2763262 RepID=UPI001D09EDB1|nr:UDP-2,3-diacylglucosamine diphosphatase LpxI [Roseobacter sp. H9]